MARKIQVAANLPPEMLEQIKMLAAEETRSLSEQITHLIMLGLRQTVPSTQQLNIAALQANIERLQDAEEEI